VPGGGLRTPLQADTVTPTTERSATVSSTKTNGKDGGFLPPPPEPIYSIAAALDLLTEAGGFALLREVIPEDSRDYERVTQEVSNFLALARVAVNTAFDSLEVEA
jgi:hypothetical protein